MRTEQQIQQIVDDVRHRLARVPGKPLEVSDRKLDDNWLYIVVTPTHPEGRALEHVELMTSIERELRAAGTEEVLLVPALQD